MSPTNGSLAEWLERYGLGQYAQTFAENHIDYGTLLDLNEDDLKSLGLSLGHHKRLIKAIGELARQESMSAVSNKTIAAFSPTDAHEPEIRQITVMFCDILSDPPNFRKNSIPKIFAR